MVTTILHPLLSNARLWIGTVLAYAFLATVTIHLGCGKPSLSQFWSVMTELGGQCDGHSLPVVWPSDAALLAILLHRPRAKLSLVLSAGLAGNLLANLITREAFLVPALLAPANLLGVAIAGTMLRRKLGTLSLLATPSTGGYFMTVAGILAPAASAIVGATVARWGFGHPFGTGLLIWFLAESLGLLLFTPVLLAMMRGEFRAWLHEPSEGGRVEMLAMQLLVAASSYLVFFALPNAMLYMLFPPVTLVTFRLGRLGTKMAVVIVAMFGVVGTMSGQGPIHQMTVDPVEQAVLLQAFLAALLLCSLPATATLSARRTALDEAEERQRALEERQATLSLLASTDSLTGLLNRGAFRDRVEATLAGANAPSCMLAIDLDRFKQVNDRYGHAAGDAALAHIARLLVRHLRPEDVIGRLGGDEFMVLLPDTHPKEAAMIVQRLQNALAATPLSLTCGTVLPLAMSIGAARRDATGSLDMLAAEADAALYRAKFARPIAA